MHFRYTYKTSDGVRHAGEIDADSKDAAFAALRREGIRPIRLEAQEDGRVRRLRRALNRASACFSLVTLAVLATWGLGWLWSQRGGTARDEAALAAARAEADGIVRRCQEDLAARALDIYGNWRLIEQARDCTLFTNETAVARGAVARARNAVRATLVAAHGRARTEAGRLGVERLYGTAMAALDRFDERVEACEDMFDFLWQSRGQWHVSNAVPVFCDAALTRVFEGLAANLADATTARWRRDLSDPAAR